SSAAPVAAGVPTLPAASDLDLFTGIAQRPSRAPPPAEAEGAKAVGPVRDTRADVGAEALRTQEQLSTTRQRLGAVLEQKAGIAQQAGDGVLADVHAATLGRLSQEEATLRGDLASLLEVEASQPRAEVERASFEVFLGRFEAL